MKNVSLPCSRRRLGGILVLLGIAILSACRSAPADVAPERTSLVRSVIEAFAAEREQAVWGYANLDEIRSATRMDLESEEALLDWFERIAEDDSMFFGAVREIGVFTNDDVPGLEQFLLVCECRTPGETDYVAGSFGATILEEAPADISALEVSAWYGIRLTDTCIAICGTDRHDLPAAEALPVAEVFALREQAASLPPVGGPTARLAGRDLEFSWLIYNTLVAGAAALLEDEPEIAELLGLEAYGLACRHVHDNFDEGEKHCDAIRNWELTIDTDSQSMTWDLTYDDKALYAIIEEAIGSMLPATAEAVHLDTAAAKTPRLRLRLDQPPMVLDDATVDAILEQVDR